MHTIAHRHTWISATLHAVAAPALVGAGLGALAAVSLPPLFDQGDVMT